DQTDVCCLFQHVEHDGTLVAEVHQIHAAAGHVRRGITVNAWVEFDRIAVLVPEAPCGAETVRAVAVIDHDGSSRYSALTRTRRGQMSIHFFPFFAFLAGFFGAGTSGFALAALALWFEPFPSTIRQ